MNVVICKLLRAANHTYGLELLSTALCKYQRLSSGNWILMSNSAETVSRDSEVQAVYWRKHSMLNIKQRRQKVHNQREAVNKNRQTADKILQYYSRINSDLTGGLLLIPELWVCLHFICALQWGCSVIVASTVIPMNIIIPNKPNKSVGHKQLLVSLTSLLC